jgi:CheY-like chemotaxis protein
MTASADGTPQAAAEAPLPRGRVLVVEDNPINLKVALTLLGRLGQDCESAGNGLEALEAMGRKPYDLVLMDCQMPEMDGFEATREWRRREQDGGRTPIVAVTTNAEPGDRERCLAAGMDDYIAKPVRLERLAEVLRKFGPVLDSARLDELAEIARESDPGLLADLMTGFDRDLALNLTEMRRALGASQCAEAARAGHKLTGSSASLGLVALSAEVRRLEQAAKAGDLAAASAGLLRVESEAVRARAAMARYGRQP